MANDGKQSPSPAPAQGKGADKIEHSDAHWQQTLSAEAYSVCRLAGTEAPFTGKYWDHKLDGVYHCVCCGSALFASGTKYDSGSGWPSFFIPVGENAVYTRVDNSLGMRREEVLCARCDSHLGHVFPDGPPPTGLRYCINSVALDFKSEAH